ncbi:MAG: hypothetical protein E6Q97_29405 [Desulfurellales bacterium]|nr:MAG: hypothetical protein E6Q97_29405 [Desulfurellales bacterium]
MFAVFRAKRGSRPVRVSPEYYSPERCAEYLRLLIAEGVYIDDLVVMRRTQYAIKGWEEYRTQSSNTTAR